MVKEGNYTELEFFFRNDFSGKFHTFLLRKLRLGIRYFWEEYKENYQEQMETDNETKLKKRQIWNQGKWVFFCFMLEAKIVSKLRVCTETQGHCSVASKLNISYSQVIKGMI